MVGTPARKTVNQPRVAMESENYGLVCREDRVELAHGKSVRMFFRRLILHKVDDIYDTNLQLRGVMTKEIHGGQGFQRGHVTTASHDDIGIAALIAARPVPNADAGGAMPDGLFHREPYRRWLLAGDDDIYTVAAAKAVIGDAQQAICVRWQIDTNNFGFLVHDVVD